MYIFNALFQNCGNAVAIANSDAEIVFANDKARSLLAELLPNAQGTVPAPRAQLLDVENGTPSDVLALVRQVLAGQAMCDRPFMLRSAITDDVGLTITGYAFDLPSQQFQGSVLLVRELPLPLVQALSSSHEHVNSTVAGWVSRTHLMSRIQSALNRQQCDRRVALICLDIKRLKAVNDTFGYLAGDQLLIEVAQRLSQIMQGTDVLSRLGGDEFILLIETVINQSEVAQIADNIRQVLQAPFAVNGCEFNISVDIGISMSHMQTVNANHLVKQADLAMHHAKLIFDEPYCFFEASMETNAEDSLHIEITLKKAIENGEFSLQYQPIFSVRTQTVIGVEALVRWHHPTRGLLSPVQFIPLAEKTGLIIPLGAWILEESCRQLKIWQETIDGAEDLFVSVNMSSEQFAQKGILAMIRRILDQTGLAPKYLKIEITESVLINKPISIIKVLEEIRDMGIHLSVDDFGTGYSSLSYLHQFPVDTLKIDRSFLENADSDFEKLEILQSVVRLAWNLGLEVVAEGIETERHLAQVKALRCESGQGYLFSKPLNIEAMAQVLHQQNA